MNGHTTRSELIWNGNGERLSARLKRYADNVAVGSL